MQVCADVPEVVGRFRLVMVHEWRGQMVANYEAECRNPACRLRYVIQTKPGWRDEADEARITVGHRLLCAGCDGLATKQRNEALRSAREQSCIANQAR